ncbi:non-specific serine/threonine protein kinase [Ranunculus cassubicifolius]
MVFVGLIRPTLLSILFFLLCSSVHSASEADILLKIKKSFNDPEALSSWTPNTPLCGDDPTAIWDGVICYKGTVNGLRLGGMGLDGDIDVIALKELAGLRSISFTNNSFSGPIPEFNRLGALKSLYISGNKFSGEIKGDYFSAMESLKKLWLSDNNFTGPIPVSLTKLTNLKELYLDGNHFSGPIPAFPSTLQNVNFSNNNFEGKIPDGFSTLKDASFLGNPDLCGKPLPTECPDTPPTSVQPAAPPPPGNDGGGVTVAIVTLVAVIAMLLVATLVVIKRRRKFDVLGRETFEDPVEMHVPPITASAQEIESASLVPASRGVSSTRRGSQSGKAAGAGDLIVVNDERGIFGLPDLMKAAAEVLGNGSLGSAYKAVMTNGIAVVVKRMRDMNKVTKDGFDMEFRRLGGLHHRNILTPLAYHYRKEEKLVVYEYVPRGSLLFLLHGDRGSCQAELDWPTRLKIIHGIARGMAFLHTELASYDLPHGNLKSSNIFLSSDFEPLLSDYGFWSVVNPSLAAQAMFAFKAPEAAEYHLASPKCDVYCFGIVILEILTGKFPSQYLHNGTGGTDVVQWVLSALIEGKETELFDPEIASASESYNEMEQLLYIGAACVEQNPEKRLTMRDAVKKIEEIQIGEGRAPTLKEEYAKLSASPIRP